MTVLVGVMQLPVPQDADQVRAYLNGTIADGGLWTGLSRASDHDHTGGLNGKPISVASIPDGSITTGKLDPSVLLPYALVDGSKPFTGQVALNGDAIVRNTLYFGAKPAGAADVTVARTGAGALRLDAHLGVGVNVPLSPAPNPVYASVHVGATGSIRGYTGADADVIYLASNTYLSGANEVAMRNAPAVRVGAEGGEFIVRTYAAVAAGATQTPVVRARIGTTGTLTLVSANPALVAGGDIVSDSDLARNIGSVSNRFANVYSTNVSAGTGANLFLNGPAGYVLPINDNGIASGHPTFRWVAVYAVNGTIQTSSAELKQDITPLDPAACYEAAKTVRWYDFRYQPPAYTEPEPPPDIAYDASDSNEVRAEKKAQRDTLIDESRAAHARMLVETAPTRHQRGFVFPPAGETKDDLGEMIPPVPDLFGLDDRESTTPQADLATLGCAMQEIIRRLEALETRPN